MRHSVLALGILLIVAGSASANKAAIAQGIPDASVVGSAHFSVALWDVYDATLYAPKGKWSDANPCALTLRYLREIDGVDIAKRSTEEIRKQGFSDEAKLSQWDAKMRSIFPDVKEGTELTAILTTKGSTVFYEGSKKIGTIEDAAFGPAFFGIWLSPKTSEPALRKKLLGLP